MSSSIHSHNKRKDPRFPFAHTYSIVARDPHTGEMGAAVQSHWFSTGSLVIWAEAGVGAVATQAMVDPGYGPLGLELMFTGISASTTLENLLFQDPRKEVRQVAMVDRHGNIGVHTGSKCIGEAGHVVGEGFSVQANMMINNTVWHVMAEAYQNSTGRLANRMMAALQAAQEAGGDIRGQQSAAMLVVKAKSSRKPWEDTLIDLRVEDHPDPLAELRRLIDVQEAYEWMNKGDDFLVKDKIDLALQAYQTAAGLAPHLSELPFWHAVTLAEMNRVEEALPLFAKVFQSDGNWAELLKRLPAAGLLRDDQNMINRILSVLSTSSG
jgi:uncharacterized Ntn-hydrolase superfamily protein